jgi:hypothetical protein
MKRPKWMDFKEFRKKRKEAAEKLKQYLKGKIIKAGGGPKIKGRKFFHDTFKQQRSASFLRKKRARRKKKNKMAYASRRINRLRSK